MKARFSSMVPNASSVAARRRYGDFGAPLPLVVVVVSDIDSLTKHPSVICRKISGVGWIGRGGRTAGEQPESEAVQVTLLHGFRSGQLHGSDGVVALVLVGMEIYEPAGALRTRWILLHHFNADGGARELVPMIVDELPGLIVHLEGAHFGSSPCGRIAHFEGAGAGGTLTTISGQYLDKLIVFQVRGFHFEPSDAERVVVVLHHNALGIRQPAAIRNHAVVEHDRIPTGGHLFGQVNVIGVWPQFLDESGRIGIDRK